MLTDWLALAPGVLLSAVALLAFALPARHGERDRARRSLQFLRHWYGSCYDRFVWLGLDDPHAMRRCRGSIAAALAARDRRTAEGVRRLVRFVIVAQRELREGTIDEERVLAPLAYPIFIVTSVLMPLDSPAARQSHDLTWLRSRAYWHLGKRARYRPWPPVRSGYAPVDPLRALPARL